MPRTPKELKEALLNLVQDPERKLDYSIQTVIYSFIATLIDNPVTRPKSIRTSVVGDGGIWVEFHEPAANPRHFVVFHVLEDKIRVVVILNHDGVNGTYARHVSHLRRIVPIEEVASTTEHLIAWASALLTAPDLL